MFLDIKTAALISFGLSLFLSGLMYSVHKQSVNIKGPEYWVYNNLFNAIGIILFLGFSASGKGYWLILSNAFTALGDCLYVAGIWAFMQKRIQWKLLLFLCLLMTGQTLFFTYLVPETVVRRVLFSIIMAFISSLAAKEFFGKVSSGIRTAFRLNGYLLLFLVSGLLIRGGLVVVYPNGDVLASSVANNILYIFLLFTQVGIAFGSMLMVNYRIASDLGRMNEGKTFLFSILAHDLRSPMNTIQHFMEFIEDESFPKEKRAVVIGELKKMTRTTNTLLENLLDWSLNESNSINTTPVRIHLAGLADTALLLHTETARLKDIRLIVDVPLTTYVLADERMLGAILRNLITNAIKFSHPGGKVLLEACVDGKYVKLHIRDSGVGISPERLATLFDLNHTRSNTGTGGERGTGLGLIVCKNFVEQNRGTLTIRSTKGEGTDVEVVLPCADEVLEM